MHADPECDDHSPTRRQALSPAAIGSRTRPATAPHVEHDHGDADGERPSGGPSRAAIPEPSASGQPDGQAIPELRRRAERDNLAQWLANTFPTSSTGRRRAFHGAGGVYLTNARSAKLQPKLLATGTLANTMPQVISAGFGVYANSTALSGGKLRRALRFNMSTGGTGSHTFNVGTDGARVRVPDGPTLSVIQLLIDTNNHATSPGRDLPAGLGSTWSSPASTVRRHHTWSRMIGVRQQ